MELIPVESSNVRSIGYAAEFRLLRVIFKDDAVYDYPDVYPQMHAALMASGSKGRFIRNNLATRGFRCGTTSALATSADGARSSEPARADPHAGTGDASSRLQTYDPDDCCPIAKAIESGRLEDADSWTCPKCGTVWKPEQVHGFEGAPRHWSPHPVIVIF